MTPNPGPILPKDVSGTERIEGMMPVGGSDNPPEAGAFQNLLQKQSTAQMPKTTFATSPFELARGGAPQLATGPSLATLNTQVLKAQTTLGDINNMLATPNLKVKPSSKYILRNKLSEATQQLHTVNSKVGGELPKEEQELPAMSGPFAKFLSYVGGSQVALANTQKQLQSLAEKQESLNPAEMLFVQIKLNKAQQLLDYSSVLLSKAIDDMKSLFSIQL